MTRTTILLVDDHALLRKGLCALIEKEEDLKVIGEAGDGRQAVDLVRQLKPEVVVMDINMPNLDGIEATRQILSDSPESKVLALSIHSGKRYVEKMLQAGAAGYLLKESAPEELIMAIRALQAGKGYLSADITDIVLSRLRQEPQEREAKASRPDTRYPAGKLYKPELPVGIVHRRELVERLERDSEKKLILVIAPAGYGKSTLICDWLEHYGRRNVWLAFDENYNDTESFLRYLIAAISDVVPKFGSTIKPLLSYATIPSPDVLAEAMVADFTTIQTPIVLALDDYHRITSKTVQEMVIQMLQKLPDGIQLVILSRHDPPWPLSRWRVSGWMRDLRAVDLSFSFEEVGVFFKDFHFDPRTLANLHNLTEGWITGLQLVKLSLVDEKDPEHFVRNFNDRLIVDYLMEEVVSRQPPDMVEFLSVTAMFDRFCASLCDALLADGNARQMGSQSYIDRLEKENLFLVPLDRDRLWFRYHHLFQNLLQQHLRQNLSVERKTLIRHRAGEWFANRGLSTEALHHFLAIGEVREAAGLVEEQAHILLDESSEIRILDKWLSLFPDSSMRILPSLMVVKAIRNVYTYNLVEALSLGERAKEFLRAPSCSVSEPRRQSLLGDIETTFAFCLYWQGDVESALQHAEQAVHLVPEEHKTAYGWAITYAAFSLALLGRQKEALDLLFEALSKDHATGSRMAGQLLACRAAIHTYTGNLSAIRKSARQMLSIHEGVPLLDYWSGQAHYFLGSVAYESNFLDEAEDHFRHNEKLRFRMDPRAYHDSLLTRARIALAKNEAAAADKLVSSARQFAIETKDPSSLEFSNLFELRLRVRREKTSSYREIKAALPDYNQYWIEPSSLILAEYRICCRSPEDIAIALEILEQALQRAHQNHNQKQVIQFLAVKAVALKCAGNLDNALEVLEESLHMAEASGFVRTFLDRGPEMAGLLKALLAKGQENFYIRRVVEAFPAAHPRVETVASSLLSENQQEELLPCPLSNREFEVLLLLEKRLSNKEIAERLYLSPETVKKHASNIFSKLNASNRRQAVEIARRCSLFSPR